MKNKNIIIAIVAVIIIIFILCIGIIIINQNDDNNFNNSSKEYNEKELETIFFNMSSTTIDITENEIRTKDSGIEPYGVFVISFSYDSERPEFGFKSPSGKLYYTDCQNDIEGKNYEFSVSSSDSWASVALPAEEGTWYLYYDKKSNASIDYSIINESNEYEEDSYSYNEENFEDEDIKDYKKYNKFKRQFSLNIPDNYSFDNNMHKFITNDIANIINQGENVEFAGYSPNNSQITIYINILKSNSSEDVTNIALNVAYKAIDKWNSIYNN